MIKRIIQRQNLLSWLIVGLCALAAGSLFLKWIAIFGDSFTLLKLGDFAQDVAGLFGEGGAVVARIPLILRCAVCALLLSYIALISATLLGSHRLRTTAGVFVFTLTMAVPVGIFIAEHKLNAYVAKISMGFLPVMLTNTAVPWIVLAIGLAGCILTLIQAVKGSKITMKTHAVRIYGKNDLRLEEFELPALKDDEILAEIVSDAICMSSYKAAIQGADHKRVPNDVAENPTMLGHEFCGRLVQVGAKWKDSFKEGQKFVIQPALNYKGSYDAPGYSYKFIGGDATYVIIPSEVMELGCLLSYDKEEFFYGSLSEPMSCIVGGFHANYHTTNGSYIHDMGVKIGGCMAILAGAGPMGLGAIDYALHCERKPSMLVVTDIDQVKLDRAAELFSAEKAAQDGIKLYFVNTSGYENPEEYLRSLTPDSAGYDDVFVYAPVRPVVETGDKILGKDGCLNFFAGPINPAFAAEFNFYNVHYASTHIVGTSGGNTDDMKESISMCEQGLIDPSVMITHVGGLDSVIETTLNLPKIPGGKKLIYTHISMPLTAIEDFAKVGENCPVCAKLAEIVARNNGLWCLEAEQYLLANGKKLGA